MDLSKTYISIKPNNISFSTFLRLETIEQKRSLFRSRKGNILMSVLVIVLVIGSYYHN